MPDPSAPPADTAPEGSTPPANPGTGTPANDTPPVDKPSGDFTIPEDYQKRPIEGQKDKFENAWTDKVKSVDDLWKVAAESQKLLGKKNLTPDFKNATPNEIEAYFNQIRPESPEAYKFSTEEGYEPNETDKALGQMLHSIGLSEFQANKLIPAFQEFTGGLKKEMYDPDAFISSMEEHFGKGFEAKTTQVREFIEGEMKPDLKEAFESIPNEHLATFYRWASNLMDAYGVAEGGPNSGKPEFGTPANIEETRNAIRKEIAELSKKPHTSDQKKALTDKLTATYKK